MNIKQLADWLDDHEIVYQFHGLHSLYVEDEFDANPTIKLNWKFTPLYFQEEVKGKMRYSSNSVAITLLTDTSFEIDNRLLCSKFVKYSDKENISIFEMPIPELYNLEGSDEFIFEQLEKYFMQIKSFKRWLPNALKYVKIKTICKEE